MVNVIRAEKLRGPESMKRQLSQRTKMMAASLFVFLAALSSMQISAQEPNQPQDEPPAVQAQRDGNWRNLLNLSEDQMARIRQIRQQNMPEAQAIRRRVRQAQRALDQAIYADNSSEGEIEQRARALIEAQAAEVRMRASVELSIRRVLTPEQLNIFRRVRQERMNAPRGGRRLENADQQRPPGNPRLENGINRPPAPLEGNRPGQINTNSTPTLGPRGRRLGLPRRIRP